MKGLLPILVSKELNFAQNRQNFFQTKASVALFQTANFLKNEHYRKIGKRDSIFINAKDILPTSSKFNNYGACHYRPDIIS